MLAPRAEALGYNLRRMPHGIPGAAPLL